jgi:hypothetical protein
MLFVSKKTPDVILHGIEVTLLPILFLNYYTIPLCYLANDKITRMNVQNLIFVDFRFHYHP